MDTFYHRSYKEFSDLKSYE